TAVVASQQKSPRRSSQAIVPPVSTIKMFWLLCEFRQCSNSRSTHGDVALLGEAMSTRYSEASRASAILGQSSGATARLVWSRKIRKLRIRYQGLANRSRPL